MANPLYQMALFLYLVYVLIKLMKVYLASDHAGFELKNGIKKYLQSEGYDLEDLGNLAYNPEDDYPEFISKAAEKISVSPEELAIVFGKSGAGEAMVANKFKNVRCAQGFSRENVRLAREHNNANVLSLGSLFIDLETAKGLVDEFLKTAFSGESRHIRRLEEITKIEQKNYA